jgi:hypothetical protein
MERSTDTETMEKLFMSDVAALGGDYLVSESLPAPMLPDVEHHITDRNVVTVQGYYLETLLAEMTVPGGRGERLAFVSSSSASPARRSGPNRGGGPPSGRCRRWPPRWTG